MGFSELEERAGGDERCGAGDELRRSGTHDEHELPGRRDDRAYGKHIVAAARELVTDRRVDEPCGAYGQRRARRQRTDAGVTGRVVALCEREQRYLVEAIDKDIDLGDHMDDAVKSLRIVVAADKSVKTGEVVRL